MQIRKIGPNHLRGLVGQTHNRKTPTQAGQVSFNDLLQEKLQKSNLQYSKHVTLKMESLGIELDENLKGKLEQATHKAREKNIKEGLVLNDKYGFVVSVKNNTVITVVDLKNMKDNVFTNIDGAVII